MYSTLPSGAPPPPMIVVDAGSNPVNINNNNDNGVNIINKNINHHGNHEYESYKTNKRVMIGQYRVEKTLGKGSFCKVKLVTHTVTREKYAMKIMKIGLNAAKLTEIQRETEVLRKLDHPYIIRLYQVLYRDECNQISVADLCNYPKGNVKCLYMIMELAEGGELFDYIIKNHHLTEDESRRIFRQIVSGLEYMHAHLVVHRDLKPENIVLTSAGVAKINDFGLSNFVDPGMRMSTFCGSPVYAAPEVVTKKMYYGPAVDIWSLGVILFTITTGHLPWKPYKSHVDNFYDMIHGRFNIPSNINLSSDCVDLLKKMMCPDPKKRYTIQEVRQHPWTNVGFSSLPESKFETYPPLSSIDSAIVKKMRKMGYSTKKATDALVKNEQGPMLTTYHVLLEKQKLKETTDMMNTLLLTSPNPVIGTNLSSSSSADRILPRLNISLPNPPSPSSSAPPSPVSLSSSTTIGPPKLSLEPARITVSDSISLPNIKPKLSLLIPSPCSSPSSPLSQSPVAGAQSPSMPTPLSLGIPPSSLSSSNKQKSATPAGLWRTLKPSSSSSSSLNESLLTPSTNSSASTSPRSPRSPRGRIDSVTDNTLVRKRGATISPGSPPDTTTMDGLEDHYQHSNMNGNYNNNSRSVNKSKQLEKHSRLSMSVQHQHSGSHTSPSSPVLSDSSDLPRSEDPALKNLDQNPKTLVRRKSMSAGDIPTLNKSTNEERKDKSGGFMGFFMKFNLKTPKK
eukprot:TRINITY_DN6037_c0_g1_i1.p1 TRINITY_DN6037_c0_g1~~TRINITY_DN6037_c0_g1_i1.p1  ORF type:complete len:734 (+),score=154.83 TRINITY_DN6037_c0_g1_i1:199-2400(+)